MFGTAIIVFREVLEASIIIGILAAATRNIPGSRRWLVAGMLAEQQYGDHLAGWQRIAADNRQLAAVEALRAADDLRSMQIESREIRLSIAPGEFDRALSRLNADETSAAGHIEIALEITDDPPTKNLYSPGTSSQSSFCSLKMERNLGSSLRVMVFDSPAANCTFSQATSRLGGSCAAAGNPAYTCAISAPARGVGCAGLSAWEGARASTAHSGSVKSEWMAPRPHAPLFRLQYPSVSFQLQYHSQLLPRPPFSPHLATYLELRCPLIRTAAR